MAFKEKERSRSYNAEEVSRILRRALRPGREDAVSYQELSEIAGDLGVDVESLDAAIAQETADIDLEKARKKWLKRRRSEFNPHFWSFTIVMAGLFLIDIFSGSGWWFQWPLLGWGMGLAFHFRKSYFPSEGKIEKGARKMLLKQKARA